MQMSVIIKQEFKEHSDSTQKAFREHLESAQSTKFVREKSDFVIPSEPKILRLVLN